MNRHDHPIIQAVYATTPSNLGDMASCPLNYFRFGENGRERRTMHLHVRNDEKKARAWPTIIGGGGLFKRNNERSMRHWHKTASKTVVWGAGLNDNDGRLQDYGAEWRNGKRLLMGVRDNLTADPEWVPCASCMHPLFEEFRDQMKYREWAFYEGWETINGLSPAGRLSCWGLHNMRQAIEFLASTSVVVTASYHGAYWATLLGCKVAVIPENDAAKFFHLRWPVPIGHTSHDLIKKAVAHPNALQEARERTTAYANRVAEFLDMEVSRCEPAVA